jgi:putative ABC transport system substrate-binding protein
MGREHADALFVIGGSTFMVNQARVAELAPRTRLPAIYSYRENVEAGGLMANALKADFVGRAALYVDKILRGAKPPDLPIERPTKFELVINLKAASAVGITIPPALLLRADDVIR